MNIIYFVWQRMVGGTVLGGRKKGNEEEERIGNAWGRKERRECRDYESRSPFFLSFLIFFNSKYTRVAI
jgi:hypothetical protein